MGNSYGKLTPGHEEAIYRLRKEKNAHGKPRSGTEIRRALAQGIAGEPPVSISADRALKVARKLMDERDHLYTSKVQTKAPREGLQLLTKRLIVVAERETIRLERAENAGRLDANKLGKLAGALTKLHTLQERAEERGDPDAPANNGGSSADAAPPPSTFAEGLLGTGGDGDQGIEGASSPPAVADEVLDAASSSPLG